MKKIIKQILKQYSDQPFFCCIITGERGFGMSMYHINKLGGEII